jgi:hypothetical protein
MHTRWLVTAVVYLFVTRLLSSKMPTCHGISYIVDVTHYAGINEAA